MCETLAEFLVDSTSFKAVKGCFSWVVPIKQKLPFWKNETKGKKCYGIKLLQNQPSLMHIPRFEKNVKEAYKCDYLLKGYKVCGLITSQLMLRKR